MAGLCLSRRMNQSVMIGDSIKIKIIGINNGVVRLHFDAPTDISIHREEVFERIKQDGETRNRNRPEVGIGDTIDLRVPNRGDGSTQESTGEETNITEEKDGNTG